MVPGGSAKPLSRCDLHWLWSGGRTRGHKNLDMVSVRGRVRRLGCVGWSDRPGPAGRPAVTALVCGPCSPAAYIVATSAPEPRWAVLRPQPRVSPNCAVTTGRGIREQWALCLRGSSLAGAVVCGVHSPSFLPKGDCFLLCFPNVWVRGSEIHEPVPQPSFSRDGHEASNYSNPPHIPKPTSPRPVTMASL